MNKRLIFCATLLGAASAPAWAGNDCRTLEPVPSPSPVTVTYSPFDAADTMKSANVEVRTQDCPDNRNIFLEIGSDDPSVTDGHVINARGPGGAIIHATVTDRAGNQGAGSDDRFNVKAGIVTLYYFVQRGQVVPPGEYRAQLVAKERLDQGNNVTDTVRPFDLVIIVGPAVGLVAAIGRDIDLGELGDNDTATAPVQFDAYANVDYQLGIRSDQDFQLRHGTASIPYDPVLDNSVVATSHPIRDFTRPLGPESRRRHSLNVRVPSIAGKPAGEYDDVLTVEISPKLGG